MGRIADLRDDPTYLLEHGHKRPWQEVADLENIGERTARRQYKEETVTDGPDPVDQMRERLKKQAETREATKVLKATAKEKNFREWLVGELHGLVPQVSPVQFWRDELTLLQASPDASVEEVVYELSDFHLDEIVKKEAVLGLNEYNLDVGLKRAWDFLRRSFHILDRLERGGGWVFPNAVVSINGDMITGAVHGLERHTVFGNVVLNSWVCAQLLRDMILAIKKRHQKVRVFFTPGNHTRFESEKNYNDPLRTWDAVIGLIVAEGLANQPDITVEVPNSYFAQFQVQGWNFLQTHGEELASQFGIGIERMQQRLTHLQDVHYFLLGHWHQEAIHPSLQGKVFYNGSLIGGNAYSLGKLGKMTPPSQWMLLVKDDQGISAPWEITPDLWPDEDAPSFGPYELPN